MSQTLDGEDEFGRMTRKATAKVTKYSEGTLANWATAGIGPKPYRLRGKVFYLAKEVRDFALAPTKGA